MSKTQITTKTVEERDAVDANDIDPLELTPLFDRGRDRKSKTITKISIRRTDPDEGHLGYLAPDASEQDIKQKYGGGEFTLQAKNDSGQIVHTLTNFKIAGDPVFQSEIAEARWMRLNRVTARSNGEGGGGLKDVLTLIEEREAKRREEDRERRSQERQDALDREERNRKEQRDHEEKLARDNAERDERRRKDETERDERRRVQHREDLDRAEAANKAQLAQTQQFFTQLQAMTKREDRDGAATDPVKLLTSGMELALKMRGDGGGGEPTDALTALLSRLPETLAEVRTTAKEAYREVKGKPAPDAAADAGDVVTLTGSTATRLTQMIAILQRAGKDPEKVIAGMADHVIGLAKQGNKRAAPTAAPAKPTRPTRPPAKLASRKAQTKKASH